MHYTSLIVLFGLHYSSPYNEINVINIVFLKKLKPCSDRRKNMSFYI